MNHPTRENWMDFLYDELPPEQRTPLAAHLESCAECRAQLDQWQGAKVSLDAWQLPKRAPKRQSLWQPLRWAAAAAVMIGVGFALASLAAPKFDVAALRAEMKRELQRQFASEREALRTQIAGELRQQWQSELEELQAQRVSDYAALRKELETLAVNAEDSFETAQRQIVQLASFTQPTASPGNSK